MKVVHTYGRFKRLVTELTKDKAVLHDGSLRDECMNNHWFDTTPRRGI